MPFPVETEPGARPRAAALEFPPTAQLPLIIGHRGACGYRPEHTLASYELAARLGADFLEPDLVSTADGELVARHEPEIGGTTDVAAHPEFADRRCTKLIDGQPRRGWFAEDFTLAELRTLRAVERIPDTRGRNTRFDGRFTVPTFAEVLELAVRLSEELGRTIGVYPETKNPGYHASVGLALEPPLVRQLKDAGLDRADAAVYVQSFETSNLRELAAVLKVPLVQLVDADEPPADLVAAGVHADHRTLLCPEGLREMAEYATVVAPDKSLVVTPDGVPTRLLPDAHAAGLRVHAYTFRNENRFLPESLRSAAGPNAHGDALAELARFLHAGVDAVFTDHPDTAVFARAEHLTPG